MDDDMDRTYRRIRTKEEARMALAGNWMKGIVLTLVFALVLLFCLQFIPVYVPQLQITNEELQSMDAEALSALMLEMLWASFIPASVNRNYILLLICSALLLLFLGMPLRIGICQFFQQVSRKQKPKLRVAFSWYLSLERVFRSIGLFLWLGVLYVLWAVLFFAVPAGMIVLANLYHQPVLSGLGAILSIAGLVLFILKIQMYEPAYYLFADHPEQGVFSAVRQSVKITRGKVLECLVFRLSFWLWSLFSMLFMFIKLIADPYYQTSFAHFVDGLVSRATQKELVQGQGACE